MLMLTVEEFESWKCRKIYYTCKEEFDIKEKHRKVRDHYHSTCK